MRASPMSAIVKVAAAAVCCVALVWLALERRAPPRDPAPVAPPAPVAAVDVLDSQPEAKTREPAPRRTPEPAPEAPAALPAERAPSTPTDGPAIEGLVLRGTTPVGRGTVYFRPGNRLPVPRSPEETLSSSSPTELAKRAIDSEGRFRIAPLEPGLYTLAVDVGNGPAFETTVEVSAERNENRIVIVLGSSRIFGHVYDAQGRPVAGAALSVGMEAGGRAFKSRAFTDESGAYDVHDVPAGSHWLVVNREGDPSWWADVDLMRRLAPLVDGETRRVDVGSPRPSAVWRGTVRTRDGELVLRDVTIGVTHTETTAFTEFRFAAGARFKLPLEPGTYRVSLTIEGGSKLGIPMPDVKVGTADFDADLVVPGARVHGTVLGWTANVPGERYPRRLEVAIRPRGEISGIRTVDVGDDGAFVFDAVPAGAWTVTTDPFELSEGSVSEVTVREEDTEVLLSISVKAP